ncbi:zinc-dependent alcohol dehydrogenase family protein [Brevibacterium daeguense]|uniref:Zinc-dependent alcohol dehydrogenase family protein n=1 Tax=Brevibacterium daeguense TaxID=909936 RepID=A0ABP8ELM7_9MICO|nr:zinc-dependent alcohol dehydrogenase family protein [Brevibacterium daeguense]
MRAVYFEKFRTEPIIAKLPDPSAPADGVVIDVEATGLCRSDWHAWSGHDDTVQLPHVPGHELVGTIADLGSDVENWHVGQRVTTPFVGGCGSCEWCSSGNAQVCPDQTQPGFTHFGSWADKVVVRHADLNLVELPEDLPAEAAFSLGCRFATSFRGLKHRAKVRDGELVAVFGCGGVGLSAVMIARALGARVVAVDINDDALDLAQQHGAEATVNSRELAPDRVATAVIDAVGEAPAVTVEALGLQDTMNAALRSLAPLGRHVQIGLLAEPPVTAVPRIIALELSFLGTHGMAAADYPELVDLVRSGALRPQDLVTRSISLDEVPASLLEMDSGTRPGMTLIRP